MLEYLVPPDILKSKGDLLLISCMNRKLQAEIEKCQACVQVGTRQATIFLQVEANKKTHDYVHSMTILSQSNIQMSNQYKAIHI